MSRYYGFAYHQRCLDYLKTRPQKIRRQIIARIERLAADPFPATSKVLRGVEDSDGRVIYRERSGDYRIIYVVRDPIVVVLDIDHRKDVYKTMPKQMKNEDLTMPADEFDRLMGAALQTPGVQATADPAVIAAAPADGTRRKSSAAKRKK